MGLSEVLVAQCVCGLLWGFLAGQPLIIQTTTAAFVMFEGSLYKVLFFIFLSCGSFLTCCIFSSAMPTVWNIWLFECGQEPGSYC
jgi:hypothetical protein